MKQFVYSFGKGKAEGGKDMKFILGGKGANLAEMTNLGIPVPPGFTISTEVCKHYNENDKKYPFGLDEQIDKAIKELEETTGKVFGSPTNPLLVSVRSGAAASMPGMMDTILNLGLNETTLQGMIKKTDNPRFAWDAYRRFIQMFSNVVENIEHEKYEHIIAQVKAQKGHTQDTDLTAADWQIVVAEYKKLFKLEEL